jgi:hypothetical protein
MRSVVPLFLAALAASAPAIAVENVPVAAFNSVGLRGGGEVTMRPGPVQRVTIVEGSSQFTHIYVERHGQLKIDACNERCPQHYRLRVLIESPHMVPTLAVDGGGTITAAPGFGQPRQLTLAVAGGGLIDTQAAPSGVVTAAVNGGGQIKARPLSVLTAAVNGGGEIRYLGNPVVTSAISGGGNVRPGN